MLKQTVTLTDNWELLFDFDHQYENPADALASSAWRAAKVPGCWDVLTDNKLADGAVWYKLTFTAPSEYGGEQAAIDFEGVNYFSEIWLNGQKIGEHEGGWSGFRIVTGEALRVGETNDLVLRIYKQGEKYPLRQCLAGFLPDVGIIFGGIWKPVHLGVIPQGELADVFVETHTLEGTPRAAISYRLETAASAGAWTVDARLRGVDGSVVTERLGISASDGNGIIELSGNESIALWSPEKPVLYTVELTLSHSGEAIDRYEHRFGFKTWSIEGERLLLNGNPVHMRGILHWGWYGDLIAPIPDRETIRAELSRLKEGGFNMVKHCLYVPVREYYELADELGFILWQELPMWLPEVNEEFKARAFEQYEAIIKEIRSYTSIGIWTLGCELNHEADSEFLKDLYEQAKRLTGGAIIRDNSGSGECYGGLLKEYADFYDYHFYTDVHFYPDLLSRFAGPWREKKPWVFGEFCDYDEFRPISRVIERKGERPWWLQSDIEANPIARDVRVQYHRQDAKLNMLPLPFTEAELTANSRESAYVYRKAVLEQVRAYPHINGYTLTSIQDSGLASSAVFDDFGEWKQPPARFKQINGATMITVTWDARRNWINGGDRLTPWDSFNYNPGETIRPHLAISHYGDTAIEAGTLRWTWTIDGQLASSGERTVEHLASGDFKEIAVAEWTLPQTEVPLQLVLHAEVEANGQVIATNEWPIWVLPKAARPAEQLAAIAIDDGGNGQFRGWAEANPGVRKWKETGDNDGARVLLTARWTPAMEKFVADGGHALYVERGYGPLAVKPMPFWRESLQLFHKHPIMDAFPHRDHTSMLLYGLATDLVLDRLQLGEHTPIMDRLDARIFELDRYMIEERVGAGKRISTTLRLEGGLGSQPNGLMSNPAALYLLDCILNELL
ncbi:glycosyl hydrolase family 2 [Paenibacillus taihuensis]|uniref:Glycosyl hydrolase family 2 n=1 Tax=Paenibacillus taihuensis TaxID=1156355 RepID=A0A3D9Q479_9BACL|nr:sugar-binding domain-containing protein [Paenibacillus taihuensis]REE57579.1 glycosyl hydrolase family 2 [Paenibacillus taihuensis]